MSKIKKWFTEAIAGAFFQSILQAILPGNFWPMVWGVLFTVVALIGGWTMQWGWPALLIAALVSLAATFVTANNVVAWRERRTALKQPVALQVAKSPYDAENDTHQKEIHMEGGFNSNNPTVEVEFLTDGYPQRYFTWEMETENGKQVNVQRYSMLLKNTSNVDLENVTVKLEKVVEEGSEELSTYLGYTLPLEASSPHIRKKDAAWVKLISYRKQDGPYCISIELPERDDASKEGKLFRPHNRRDLYVAIRADRGIYLPARFQCWVDDHGSLIMKRLNLDS